MSERSLGKSEGSPEKDKDAIRLETLKKRRFFSESESVVND
jgi:hypothetical protein